MIKKVIAAMSAFALSLSAFAGTAFADLTTHDPTTNWYTLNSGTTYTDTTDEYGAQYITVKCTGIDELAVAAAVVRILVPHGAILTDEENGDFGVTSGVGLSYGSGRNVKYPSYTLVLVDDESPENDGRVDVPNDGYDTLSVVIAGMYEYTNADEVMFEMWVTPTDPTKDLEISMSDVTLALYDPEDETGATMVEWLAEDYPQWLNTTKYVLAAGTSTITEKKDVVGPNDPIDNYIGDETTDGDNEKTSDQSKAWGLSIDKVEGKTYVYKLYADSIAKYKKAADLVNDDSLTGNIKVGLILTYDPSDSAFAAIDGATIEVDE